MFVTDSEQNKQLDLGFEKFKSYFEDEVFALISDMKIYADDQQEQEYLVHNILNMAYSEMIYPVVLKITHIMGHTIEEAVQLTIERWLKEEENAIVTAWTFFECYLTFCGMALDKLRAIEYNDYVVNEANVKFSEAEALESGNE